MRIIVVACTQVYVVYFLGIIYVEEQTGLQ